MGLFLGAPSGAFGTVLFSISPNIFAMLIAYFIGILRGKKK
jgi:ABC-type cobalt transport system substrate-binding protein